MKVPLVLVSGLLSNDLLWTHQKDHLSAIADVRIVSPTEDTPQKMVQAILDQAPPIFALAGHSMGGWLCLEAMRAAHARVSKLCLINTTARMDSEEKRAKRKEMILRAQNGQFREVAKDLVKNFVFNSRVSSAVERMFLQVGEEAFIRQEKAMLARRETMSILPRIHCPTLVIYASEDKVFSLEEHREIVENISKAKLELVENSGHMSPMEMPQAVTSLLRFWLHH